MLALGLVGREPERGRVALVPVDHDDAPRARPAQPAAHIHHHRGQGGRPQRERARPGQVVGRDAGRPERGDDRAEAGGDPLGDGGRGEGVGAQRQVPVVLLDAARGDDGGAAGRDQGGRRRLGQPLDQQVRMAGHRIPAALAHSLPTPGQTPGPPRSALLPAGNARW